MKAVIFAAGKGTRFGRLTQKIPKPLIKIGRHPILWSVLSELPDEITEIIIVVGHFGHKIKDYFGKDFRGRPIFYADQNDLNGTFGALLAAKPFLDKNKFLVLNGDDLYEKKDLEYCLRHSLAFGVYKGASDGKKFYAVVSDKKGVLRGFRKPESEKHFLIGTGVYVLDRRIFRYKPVKIKNGAEYGLPQTILKMAAKHPVKVVLMNFWQPINTPADLKRARRAGDFKKHARQNNHKRSQGS
ncbi:nucleotidyltransferase family protein [Candidatus Wolfebacteria bacterium]|nr:nucleotidyltransferase family protein [Candidatus Wolfebacteria bacterium]